MKSILFISFLLTTPFYYAQNTFMGIEGTLQNKITHEAIAFAKVMIKSEDKIYDTIIDVNGKFNFPTLQNGCYTVVFQSEGIELLYPYSIQIDSRAMEMYSVKAYLEYPEGENQFFMNREPVINKK